jgi:hypothetical protein
MNSDGKTWLNSLTTEAIELFSKALMTEAENAGDKERQRFYEGMAVASKLVAMKMKGEFEHINEAFIHHLYENMKALRIREIDNGFSAGREDRKERCSFCLQEKDRLARGPFASICEDCLQFGLEIIVKDL